MGHKKHGGVMRINDVIVGCSYLVSLDGTLTHVHVKSIDPVEVVRSGKTYSTRQIRCICEKSKKFIILKSAARLKMMVGR